MVTFLLDITDYGMQCGNARKVAETGSCVVLHDVNYTYPCLHALQPDVHPLCDVPHGCRLGNAVYYEELLFSLNLITAANKIEDKERVREREKNE